MLIMAGRKNIIESILIIAPLAKNIHIVETISIFEYKPTPTVAAINDRAEVTIDFEASFTVSLSDLFTSPLFLYSAKNLSIMRIE